MGGPVGFLPRIVEGGSESLDVNHLWAQEVQDVRTRCEFHRRIPMAEKLEAERMKVIMSKLAFDREESCVRGQR